PGPRRLPLRLHEHTTGRRTFDPRALTSPAKRQFRFILSAVTASRKRSSYEVEGPLLPKTTWRRTVTYVSAKPGRMGGGRGRRLPLRQRRGRLTRDDSELRVGTSK